MHFELLQYGSRKYQEMVELRREILRKPLGLDFTGAELSEEHSDVFIAAYDDDELLGGCILCPLDDRRIKLRQMAVAANQQGNGIGAALVKYAEELARRRQFSIMVMNARDTAKGFYKKLGYEVDGDLFIEVGIRHYKMWKQL